MLWTSGLWAVMPFYLKRLLRYVSLPVLWREVFVLAFLLLSSVDIQRTQMGRSCTPQDFLRSAQPLALLLALPWLTLDPWCRLWVFMKLRVVGVVAVLFERGLFICLLFLKYWNTLSYCSLIYLRG